MTIAALLRTKGDEVVLVSPDTTLQDVVVILTDRRIGAMPVVEDGRLVGIMSERDVIHALSKSGATVLGQPVSSAMTAPAITVPPDMPLIAALSLMTRRRIRHLPVVEQEQLLGFVSIGDLVKARIDRIEEEAEALRTYIAS